MIPTFTKSYLAAAAVAGRLIVKYADPANGSTVDAADAATAFGLGVSDSVGADADQMLDVHRAGLASVELGGPVEAGDPLTADATGRAVKATASAGNTVWIVGHADGPGVLGDYIDCFVAPAALHEA